MSEDEDYDGFFKLSLLNWLMLLIELWLVFMLAVFGFITIVGAVFTALCLMMAHRTYQAQYADEVMVSRVFRTLLITALLALFYVHWVDPVGIQLIEDIFTKFMN